MKSILRSGWTWLLIYATVVCATVVWMQRARRNVLAEFTGQPQLKAWEDWRQAAAKKDGPVERRMPKSHQPPTLVLLRDHYYMSLAGMLLFESAILAFLMFVTRGMLDSSQAAEATGESSPTL